MTKEVSIQYKKAYVELNEIIKVLSKEQKDKIPESFVNYIINNMDKDYIFNYDNSKGIFDQNLMVETEALLVEVYERYLAPEEEKEMWNKYDRFCLNKIDEEKRAKTNNMFESNKKEKDTTIVKQNKEKEENNILPLKYEKENFFTKILNFFKRIIKK